MVIILENEIKIIYPRTIYDVINNYLEVKIKDIINEFMEYGKVILEQDFKYNLDITYDLYTYKNYISYIFYVSIFLGGAHPDNRIFTVNFDKESNKTITIDDILIKKDNLNILSTESRRLLKENKGIGKDKDSLEMLEVGTSTNKTNFRNFVFTNDGILIIFEQYQVAPYSSGVFRVVIPYELLDI